MKKFNTENEIRLYGKNLCKTIFHTRPDDIISLFLTDKMAKEFKSELSFLAKKKKSYHLVTRDGLEKMTKSSHHEDVCLLVKKKKNPTFDQFLKNLKPAETHLIIALENVTNPHNLGAIMRSMAHFKSKTLLVTEAKKMDTGSALRTSEGGSEFIDIIEVKKLNEALQKLKTLKFEILAATSHGGKELFKHAFAPKTVLLFGEEGPGLSQELLATFTPLNINGTGSVESLNVSVASAIILAEFYRQQHLKN